ncbi:hypothetical protein [Pedobacter sp. B4-66]|uniref:hypothetical protein n=1 Tax=Pedobacter sp. B4-66 TaxID=2817280 RepID=UPI001BD9AF24|nr:hypothetical protein [Pedobacter sp. B4-66]
MVCEELNEEPEAEPMKMNHSHGGGGIKMSHEPAANSKIVLTDSSKNKTIAITDGQQPDHHAVITTLNDGALIAWVREKNGRSEICYTNIKVN